MALYQAKIETSKTLEEAFDYVVDLRNLLEWDPGVSVAKLTSEEPIRQGSTFYVSANGANINYEMEEFNRPNNFTFCGKTRFFLSLDKISFAEVDGKNVVTYLARLDLNGPAGIFDKLLAKKFKGICDAAGEGLAKALDGSVVEAGLK